MLRSLGGDGKAVEAGEMDRLSSRTNVCFAMYRCLVWNVEAHRLFLGQVGGS
jgi:hypothetical protein